MIGSNPYVDAFQGTEVRFVALEAWPGERTPSPKLSPFRATWSSTLALLTHELRMLGARQVTIQLDMDASALRRDGYPRANARPRTPAVILSFIDRTGATQVYPCDTWNTWQDNLRAIALTIANLRQIDRYRVAKRGQQFAGFRRLTSGRPMGGATVQTSSGYEVAPAPTMSREEAARILALHSPFNARAILEGPDVADQAFRMAAKRTHPDAEEGSAEAFKLVNEARAVLVGAAA